MESAIRRVINLRMKGASIYWLEKTAEAMLMLWSYYNSGTMELAEKVIFLFGLKIDGSTYFFEMRPCKVYFRYLLNFRDSQSDLGKSENMLK